MPVVKSLLDAAGVPHDKTFVRPDTTVEVTDNAGNKTYKQVKDLSNEEKAAFDRRGTSVTGASLTGRTSNPLIFATNDIVEKNTPKIEINSKGTGLVLSGTKAALDSDMGNELQKYLKDTFRYADLTSKNVGDAINALNQSIRDQMEQRVSEGMLSVPYDDYKEYKLTMQQLQGTNPLSSTAAVPGYTKDGKKINATDDDKKTIKDWLEYYQKNYSAKERAELYNASREAIASGNYDFALWTPYLVMSGGNLRDLQSRPVYGFSTGERALAGAEALLNEGSARLVEGINQTLFRIGSTIANAQGFARRDNLKNRARRVVGTGSDIEAADIPWISESAYNEKLDSIKDKSVRALGKDDKNFLAAALGDFSSNEVDDAVRNSGTVGDLSEYISYNNYINARDNLSTVEKYDEELNKISKKAAKGREWLQEDVDTAALYAPFEVTAGSFAGTIMRMWAESGLIKAATGGLFVPAEISDAIAGKFMSMLSPTGNTLKALQTPVGSFLLSVAAEVPEDLVQTVIDDVMTGRAEDVPLLAPTGDINKDMEKLGESFAQNLTFRLIFTPIQAGENTFRNWRAAKRAARAAGIPNNIISDEYFIRTQQLKEAADAGNIIDVTDKTATIRNPDGTETVLDNVAMLHFGTDAELQERYPAVAEMLRKKGLVADVADSDIQQRIDSAKTAVENGEYANISAAIVRNANGELVDLTGKPVNVEADEGNIVAYRGQPDGDEGAFIMNDPTNKSEWGDTFFFIENPNYASNFSDNIVYFEFPKEKIVALSEFADIKKMANNIVGDELEFNKYVVDHGEEAGALLEEISYDNARAVAEYAGKPIVETAWKGDVAGSEYSYFPGIDVEFDESAATHSLSAVNSLAPQASAASIEMANQIQKALDTEPYDRTIGEIIADKYTRGGKAIGEAPNSSSYRWESPDVTKTYNTEEEVFADMPTGKNLTEVRQWEKNAHAFYMNRYMQQTMPEFTERYPTVDEQQQFVRNMDYLFDLQRIEGETLEIAAGEGALTPRAAEVDSAKGSAQEFALKKAGENVGSYHKKTTDTIEGNYEKNINNATLGGKFKPGDNLDDLAPDDKARVKNALSQLASAKATLEGALKTSDIPEAERARVGQLLSAIDNFFKDNGYEVVQPKAGDLFDETVSRQPDPTFAHSVKENVDDNSPYYQYYERILAPAVYRGDARVVEGSAIVNDFMLPDAGAGEPGGYQISGSVIGKTYENEGITYTVNEDDVRFYLDNIEPMMKSLREAGAAGQGKEAFTITGYLPHSDYDPTILTAEDSMQQGVLWREYTGASTTDEDGNFSTGWLNPDLTARYSTFVHNMLWDSLGDNVTVAKYMEEFNADGLDVAATTVEHMVGGRKRLAHLVSESDSVKAVVKNLLGDGELPSSATLEKAAKDIGSTNIVHKLYRPIYGEAKGLYQAKSAANVKLMSKSDWMRSLSTGDGTLYDNGGAMIVNGAADAKFLAKRITDAIDNGEKLDVHQMFVDYLAQNHRRTAKGASYVADKWMDKIAQKATNGGISRRALTAELNSLIYGEGANRLFRFIGRMDADQLTSANRQALDSLLFRHSALSKIKNTSGFSARINNAANKLIVARMKSLFWLNFKNAVLQTSECIRLFTEFKFGDARATIKKLATDADFRARVDEWVDMLVPERFVKSDSTAATGAMEIIADNSSVKNGELTVNKLSADDIKKFGTKLDEFGSAPVELGEAMKNRVMMAGILQEADRMGLEGNEMFNYVNQRFERIGIAANEMGRLNASDNPLFRIGANLKTFQIRQFRMFINNIHDANGAGETATYIIKNLGWKAGLALIMGKLGYSTAATLGIDPFDLMDDDYTGVDEDNYTGLDYAMLSPAAKLFLSGGFTGYITDAYWAARKAYEDNATVTEQTEGRVADEFWPGMALPGMSFDNVFNAFSGFIPGYTFGKRVYQMNELMDTGWATSATGNKMYEAPTNPLDIATGYIFGRSNTPNARAYYQTPDYLEGLMSGGLEGLGQQLGREFGGYRQFDPIDTQNYSDWFNGTAADEQQWNSGYYYFRNKVDNLQKEYQNSLGGYTTDQDKSQLDESFNQKLAEVEDQLNKFVSAYEAKHPEGIDARKMRNLTNILNLYQPVVTDTEEEREQRELDANSAALYRYTQAGLPAVTSYKRNDDGEVEPVYSPQLRSALQGEFGLPKEAATQIQQLYKDKWKKLNQQYRDRLFSTKGSNAKKAIQNEYINIVRQDLDPIVQLYGNNIWSNEDVENIIDDVFNSMVPKYGQTAKSYLKNLYKNYTGKISYNETGNTTLSQINGLLDKGKTAQAKALARTLLQRVQENRTSLSRSEMERLQKVLND